MSGYDSTAFVVMPGDAIALPSYHSQHAAPAKEVKQEETEEVSQLSFVPSS